MSESFAELFAGMPADMQDSIWRDSRAISLLTSPTVKTFGELIDAAGLRREGWLYGGRDALLFVAEQPTWGPTNNGRLAHLTYQHLGWSVELIAMRGAPNAIVRFGFGSQALGAKKQMKQLHKLARR